MKKLFLTIVVINLISTNFLLSQISNPKSQLESLLLAGDKDRNSLFQGYFQPALESSIHALNTGWFSSAKIHRKLGFDFKISLNIVKISEQSEVFDISNLNYITSNSNTIPTIFGTNKGEELTVTIPEDGIRPELSSKFISPGGVKESLPFNVVALPNLQLSVGVPLNSEITLRYVPSYNQNSVVFSSYGVGLKHNLIKYLGLIDKVPGLNISLFGSYSNLELTYSNMGGENENSSFNVSAYNALILSSFDAKLIEIYSGFGYSGGNSALTVNGKYDLSYNTSVSGEYYNFSIGGDKPIINTEFEKKKLIFNLGLKFKLAFLHTFLDYTFSDIDTISAGLAFSFR